MCKEVDKAREKVREGIFDIEVYQKRPLTIVVVQVYVDDKLYSAIEWSKVMYPDRYNRKRGVKVAIGKATKRIARAIVNGYDLEEGFSLFGSIENAIRGA